MIDLTVKEIIEATSGRLLQGNSDLIVSRISTDSRTAKEGDLFIALKGENYDGAAFIGKALEKGAIGYIVGRVRQTRPKTSHGGLSPDQLGGDCPHIVIQVDDALKALQAVAHHVLKKVNPKVIAITGSTGKTSVKDILKQVLYSGFNVEAAKANYNNEIGLPLTLLEITPQTEVVIVEMGMRGLGQIARLCKIAPPDYALITNIGKSHIELLKSQDNIIKAKTEIIQGLKKGGTIFLNSNDEATDQLSAISYQLSANVIMFGEKGDISFKDVDYDNLARPSFDLRSTVNPAKLTLSGTGGQRSTINISLPIPGAHFVSNATAAAAVAFELGMALPEIKKGLEAISLTPGRMQICQANGWIIINDSYNASPDSMKAAIQVLENVKATRKVAVLGNMLELGDMTEQAHQEIGVLVAKKDFHLLLTVGSLAASIAKAALGSGMPKQNVKSYNDFISLKQEIISYLRPDDAILIKASRAIKLDLVAEYLQKKR